MANRKMIISKLNIDDEIELIVKERLAKFSPNLSLAESLHKLGILDIDVDAIQKLSEELEI